MNWLRENWETLVFGAVCAVVMIGLCVLLARRSVDDVEG